MSNPYYKVRGPSRSPTKQKQLTPSNSEPYISNNLKEGTMLDKSNPVVSSDNDLLKRSEQVFNSQTPAQKMKIFNEMEQFMINQQEDSENLIGKHRTPKEVKNVEVLAIKKYGSGFVPV
jgi:hypothetical protein